MSKQSTSPRGSRSQSIHDLVILALFTAIIFVMNNTPLGYIDLPIIKATLIHVPRNPPPKYTFGCRFPALRSY